MPQAHRHPVRSAWRVLLLVCSSFLHAQSADLTTNIVTAPKSPRVRLLLVIQRHRCKRVCADDDPSTLRQAQSPEQRRGAAKLRVVPSRVEGREAFDMSDLQSIWRKLDADNRCPEVAAKRAAMSGSQSRRMPAPWHWTSKRGVVCDAFKSGILRASARWRCSCACAWRRKCSPRPPGPR